MSMVQLSGVSIAFGDRKILGNINFSLRPGSRVALTGANGSGKSTLMKIIAGISQPDSGARTLTKDTVVAYLPQSGIAHGGRTLLEEADLAFERLNRLELEKTEVEHRLSGAKEHTEEVQELIEHQHYLTEKLLHSGYYTRQAEIDRVLTGLGFSRSDFTKDTAAFSGGWQMRIALAKVLLSRPDVLLLDEPTNYLDLEAKNWIESFLLNLPDGYLIVSHDRHFLDSVVEETAELFYASLKMYRGGYSQYEEKRKKEIEDLIRRYDQQQEEIEKIEFFIRRFRYNASKAQMVQSRVKQLEKIDRIQIPESMKRIHFSFPEAPHSGRDVLAVEGLSKRYGENEVFADLTFPLRRGQRLVVVGVNGAGKSSLLRILAGKDKTFSGGFSYGSGVKTGFFSQDLAEEFHEDKTVLEELEASAPTDVVPRLRNLLGAFLFRGDDVYKSMGVLSGGERNRVALLKLLLKPVNLLIMDEPTNHLDLTSKDVLLEALLSFTGTLVFVSHDRYFIEKLADQVLELREGRGTMYPGDYAYYLEKLRQSEDVKIEGIGNKFSVVSSKPKNVPQDREEEKRIKRQVSKLKQEEGRLLRELAVLEEEERRLKEILNDASVYSDPVKSRELGERIRENKSRQDILTAQWEEVHVLILSN